MNKSLNLLKMAEIYYAKVVRYASEEKEECSKCKISCKECEICPKCGCVVSKK